MHTTISLTVKVVLFAIGIVVTCPKITAAQSGFLGLQVQGLDFRAANALGLNSPSGVLVRDVAVGEPGAAAGIRRGDLITKFNNKTLRTFADLILAVGTTKPQQNVTIEVQRRGERLTLVIKTKKRPAHWNVNKYASRHYEDMGFAISTLTDKVRENFSIRWGTTGLAITTVDEEKPVFGGLRLGDVIVQANLRDLWHPQQFTQHIELARKSGRDNLLLLVEGPAGFRYSLVPPTK